MASSPWIVVANESNFQKDVIERSRQVPILIDFWADWCGPCRTLTPLLEQLAHEFDGKFLLAKVNVDEAPVLAQEFHVSGIPTVVAMRDGAIVGQFTGLLPPTQLRELVQKLIPSEAQQRVREAAALERVDAEQARALYEKALELEPGNTVALAALAELALAAGEVAKARECLTKVGEGDEGWPRAQNVRARLEFHDAAAEFGALEACQSAVTADPNDLEARRRLGLVLAAAGRFEDALETLVQIVERDRDFGRQHAREPMVKIFGLLGPQSDLANRYRARLASALY